MLKAMVSSLLSWRDDTFEQELLSIGMFTEKPVYYNRAIGDGGDQAVLLRDEGRCYIAFQGTEGFLDTLSFFPVGGFPEVAGCRVHSGFYLGW